MQTCGEWNQCMALGVSSEVVDKPTTLLAEQNKRGQLKLKIGPAIPAFQPSLLRLPHALQLYDTYTPNVHTLSKCSHALQLFTCASQPYHE